MSDTAIIEFLPANHAAQRVGPEVREGLIRAQRSTISRSFGNAHSFTKHVCNDLKLELKLPDKFKGDPATRISDLPFADLSAVWTRILRNNGIPDSALPGHASQLSHRTQLVRAFSEPDEVLNWAKEKVVSVVADFPRTAAHIERGRNPGDVLDPYILAATQTLLYRGGFEQAIGATVAHKALMILEGLMGHMHEEVLGRMRGNMKNPEPRGENQELYDAVLNPFPGADIVQPPSAPGVALRIHQVKSKTGTLNASGGARLAEQMRQIRMRYAGAEIFSHSLVGTTLNGHRSMGTMVRAEPSLIITVGEAAFRVLTGSPTGAELLLRLYQNAFQLASDETGYDIQEMAEAITTTFQNRAAKAGEGFLELLLHEATRGDSDQQDSRTFVGQRRRAEQKREAARKRPAKGSS